MASGLSQIHILSYTAQRYIVTMNVMGLSIRTSSITGIPRLNTLKMIPDNQKRGVESVFIKFIKSLLMAESKLVTSENILKNTNMSTRATGNCSKYRSNGKPQRK